MASDSELKYSFQAVDVSSLVPLEFLFALVGVSHQHIAGHTSVDVALMPKKLKKVQLRCSSQGKMHISIPSPRDTLFVI